jgi:carbon-monoxide dehydrogenase large subunit
MLWALVLRSPLAHARIVHIDVNRARSIPGINAVVTGDDLPDIRVGRQIRDMPVLARQKVRFIGEKVAAVVAENKEIAEDALAAISVDYEELPAIFNPEEALKDGAPLIHDHPHMYEGAPGIINGLRNVVSFTTKEKGNAERALAESGIVLEHTFRTPFVHQGYIEPHACVGAVDPSGNFHVWASNKSPFLLRDQLAEALAVSVDRVVVHVVPVGGDFGGKGSPMDAPLCCCLAKITGRPVKMVMTYNEELLAGNPRHAAIISIKTGVEKTGQLRAMTIDGIFDSGGYGAFKPIPDVNLAAARTAGGFPYKIPAIQITSKCVYTNNLPCGHMRGPGYPQIAFAVESHIDLIAKHLGLDPVDFRMKNLVDKDDEGPFGGHWPGINAKAVLKRAVEISGFRQRKRPRIGRGVAMVQKSPGKSPTGANFFVDRSGQVTVQIGVPEQGSGSHTILRQIASEELQIPIDLVKIETGATNEVPNSGWGSGASSVSHSMGMAVLLTAQELKATMLKDVAALFRVEERSIDLRDGNFIVRDWGKQKRIPFTQLVARLIDGRGKAYDLTRVYGFDPSGKGEFAYNGVTSFCAQVAEVEVDADTGQVTIKQMTTVHDVGTVINPITHQGQIEGGIVQGMGFAVMEKLYIEEGRVLTLHLGDYKIPTIKDVPPLETKLVRNLGGPVPYKGKAIGEISIVPIAAAIANAIDDAIGVRLFDLPLSSENIYFALKDRQQKAHEAIG